MTLVSISRRLGKSKFWVRRTIGLFGGSQKRGKAKSKRREKFSCLSDRSRALITDIIRSHRGPVQIPMIIKALRKDHRVRVSPSTLRQYLRQVLGLRYRFLGVVGPHFDDLNNLLMRQLSASECIKALTEGKEIINVDESILRSSDSRT